MPPTIQIHFSAPWLAHFQSNPRQTAHFGVHSAHGQTAKSQPLQAESMRRRRKIVRRGGPLPTAAWAGDFPTGDDVDPTRPLAFRTTERQSDPLCLPGLGTGSRHDERSLTLAMLLINIRRSGFGMDECRTGLDNPRGGIIRPCQIDLSRSLFLT